MLTILFFSSARMLLGLEIWMCVAAVGLNKSLGLDCQTFGHFLFVLCRS